MVLQIGEYVDILALKKRTNAFFFLANKDKSGGTILSRLFLARHDMTWQMYSVCLNSYFFENIFSVQHVQP